MSPSLGILPVFVLHTTCWIACGSESEPRLLCSLIPLLPIHVPALVLWAAGFGCDAMEVRTLAIHRVALGPSTILLPPQTSSLVSSSVRLNQSLHPTPPGAQRRPEFFPHHTGSEGSLGKLNSSSSIA